MIAEIADDSSEQSQTDSTDRIDTKYPIPAIKE